MAKWVILGRDGVINEVRDEPILDPHDWVPLPGSIEAIGLLHEHGFRVVIATNQTDIEASEENLECIHSVHERMLSAVSESGGRIDAIFFTAPGEEADEHVKSPLMAEVERRLSPDWKRVSVVGDDLEDLDAAFDYGAKAILVRTGRGSDMLRELPSFDGLTIYSDLAAAAEALIEDSKP